MYLSLQDRSKHPQGTFDKAGRFYLTKTLPCCEGIRSPSRAYPFSHITHARSMEHVAHGLKIQAYLTPLRKIVNARKKGGVELAKELTDSKAFIQLLDDITAGLAAAKVEEQGAPA